MRVRVWTTTFALTGIALATAGLLAAASGEWPQYAADAASSKYSALDQITPQNIGQLDVAWRWASPDRELHKTNPVWRLTRNEGTPLMVKGVLYASTGLGMVAAIDPGTGHTKWVFDPEGYKAGRDAAGAGYLHRGFAYWTDGTVERLLVGTSDAYLLSIDARTGALDPRFGTGGKADLTVGIHDAVRGQNLSARRPLVAGDVVVVGNTVSDGAINKEMPPGYVHAFDVRTGRLLWTFHTVPKKGEAGYETWLEGSAEYTGATNVWGGMSYDPELDYVYMATSTPNNDYYGGQRLGDNLFAESLVCVEAKTGKRVWHFQAVRHGLWDYDFPTPPILGDITVSGRRVKAVIQVSKQAFTYVFDRKTGKPVWPIEERPVPQSTVPRERTAATQPFPTRPPAFDLQGTTEGNLMDFTPELRTRARAALQLYDHGPLFTPPSVKGTLTLPGMFGGANWGGAAFDPETGMLYVPSRTDASVHRVTPSDPARSNTLFRSGGAGPGVDQATVEGLSIFKPPYSRVTAIDLNTGTHAWMTPLGNGPRNHPLLRDLKPGPLGDSIYGASALVTKSLLFVTVMHRQYNGDPVPPSWAQWGDPDRAQKVLHVFDKRTGAVLRVVHMDGLSGAAPMTYLHEGRQYVVVATGAGETSELVAFALRP